MASREVTITGMLYDKLNRTVQNVVLIGEESYTGLGVGGGPIYPPQQPPPPLGIWGPTDPRPTPPIVIPDPPTEPPSGGADEDGFLKPPPEGGGWAFHEDYGWLYAPSGKTPHR